MTAQQIAQHRLLAPLVTVACAALGCALVLACCSLLGGCGQQQRIVSAVAVAAVEADRANAAAYEIRGEDAIEEVEALLESGAIGEHDGFAHWCRIMHDPWAEQARAECGIVALADLAIAGQHAIDAGAELSGEWIGAACGAAAALTDAWTIAEEPPAALTAARALVCGFTDAPVPPPACEVPDMPPVCEEVP